MRNDLYICLLDSPAGWKKYWNIHREQQFFLMNKGFVGMEIPKKVWARIHIWTAPKSPT